MTGFGRAHEALAAQGKGAAEHGIETPARGPAPRAGCVEALECFSNPGYPVLRDSGIGKAKMLKCSVG